MYQHIFDVSLPPGTVQFDFAANAYRYGPRLMWIGPVEYPTHPFGQFQVAYDPLTGKVIGKVGPETFTPDPKYLPFP